MLATLDFCGSGKWEVFTEFRFPLDYIK